ncbi:hypothetical protein DOY81_008695 [Sarcophaga bullata]|nr:hypothetical protein DOY81_008695 [Sarcophaga bullata]
MASPPQEPIDLLVADAQLCGDVEISPTQLLIETIVAPVGKSECLISRLISFLVVTAEPR